MIFSVFRIRLEFCWTIGVAPHIRIWDLIFRPAGRGVSWVPLVRSARGFFNSTTAVSRIELFMVLVIVCMVKLMVFIRAFLV